MTLSSQNDGAVLHEKDLVGVLDIVKDVRGENDPSPQANELADQGGDLEASVGIQTSRGFIKAKPACACGDGEHQGQLSLGSTGEFLALDAPRNAKSIEKAGRQGMIPKRP